MPMTAHCFKTGPLDIAECGPYHFLVTNYCLAIVFAKLEVQELGKRGFSPGSQPNRLERTEQPDTLTQSPVEALASLPRQ